MFSNSSVSLKLRRIGLICFLLSFSTFAETEPQDAGVPDASASDAALSEDSLDAGALDSGAADAGMQENEGYVATIETEEVYESKKTQSGAEFSRVKRPRLGAVWKEPMQAGVSRKAWSDVARDTLNNVWLMSYSEAVAYCAERKGSLPSLDDYQRLAGYMKTEQGYSPQILPNLKTIFWTSTSKSWLTAEYFNGEDASNRDLLLYMDTAAVRCVTQ